MKELMKFQGVPGKVHTSAGHRLRVDYIRPLLKKDVFYSFPCATAKAITAARSIIDKAEAVRLLEDSANGESVIFRVLDPMPRKKK